MLVSLINLNYRMMIKRTLIIALILIFAFITLMPPQPAEAAAPAAVLGLAGPVGWGILAGLAVLYVGAVVWDNYGDEIKHTVSTGVKNIYNNLTNKEQFEDEIVAHIQAEQAVGHSLPMEISETVSAEILSKVNTLAQQLTKEYDLGNYVIDNLNNTFPQSSNDLITHYSSNALSIDPILLGSIFYNKYSQIELIIDKEILFYESFFGIEVFNGYRNTHRNNYFYSWTDYDDFMYYYESTYDVSWAEAFLYEMGFSLFSAVPKNSIPITRPELRIIEGGKLQVQPPTHKEVRGVLPPPLGGGEVEFDWETEQWYDENNQVVDPNDIEFEIPEIEVIPNPNYRKEIDPNHDDYIPEADPEHPNYDPVTYPEIPGQSPAPNIPSVPVVPPVPPGQAPDPDDRDYVPINTPGNDPEYYNPTSPDPDPPVQPDPIDPLNPDPFRPEELDGRFNSFTTAFPFSLPWDIKHILELLDADPVRPSIAINEDFNGVPIQFNVDFEWLDSYMPFFRFFIFLTFAVGLIYSTRNLLGGGQ